MPASRPVAPRSTPSAYRDNVEVLRQPSAAGIQALDLGSGQPRRNMLRPVSKSSDNHKIMSSPTFVSAAHPYSDQVLRKFPGQVIACQTLEEEKLPLRIQLEPNHFAVGPYL